MNYIYCPNPESDEPILLLNTEIGGNGINGEQFSSELFSLCELGKKYISILINSSGGEVFVGYAINSSILECQRRYNISIDTINGGIAASIAGCFFQAGSRRIMLDYARLMLHNPFSSDGSVDKGLESIRMSLITMISKRSGLTELKVEELLADTSWLDAEKCLSLGLCDEIRSTEKLGKVINKYLNTININNKKNKFMMNTDYIKILNDAGSKLPENPSEDDVMNATLALIKPKADDEAVVADDFKIKNDADADTETSEDDKMNKIIADKMKVYDDKFNDLKKVYDLVIDKLISTENKLISAEKIISDNAEKIISDKVENMINSAVKAGKIQNSSIEMCKLMAKADIVTFEKFLSVQPINKTAPIIIANDFASETAKSKNETEIANALSGTQYSSFAPSLIQAATNNILTNLQDSYNPKIKK